ncbi:MAG: MBOAT family O-acyltransferase [Bacteroidales bacterium]
MIEKFKDILVYSPNEPLIFTRFYFWVFFAVVLGGYSILYKKQKPRTAYLFLVSLFFYYKSSGTYFVLLVFSTVYDYFVGNRIFKSRSDLKKKLWLVSSIFINLFVLAYFKYSGFFIKTLNTILGTDYEVFNHFNYMVNQISGSHFSLDKIVLPVGISFFTFQSISYNIDIYRKRIEPVKSILDFGFFISFFPQLVAGPIVRAAEFVPQIYQKYKLSHVQFGFAVFMILNGLLKKLFISDYIAINLIDRVFDKPMMYSGIENILALYAYSMQVYADFSGYTDIAIGVALMMGFTLPVNFNSPYKALHVGEFWKRWHISLSTWLKDYLYIPMGGNRQASFFTYLCIILIVTAGVLVPAWSWVNFGFLSSILLFFIWWLYTKDNMFRNLALSLLIVFSIFLFNENWVGFIIIMILTILWIINILYPASSKIMATDINLFLTMLIGGLWHGASWQFVIWGGLNGIGLIIYKQWQRISPFKGNHSWPVRFYSILLTFNFITLTRIWFRSSSMENVNDMIHQIVHAVEPEQLIPLLSAYKNIIVLLVFAFTVHWLPSNFKSKYRLKFANLPLWAIAFITILTVFFIYQFQTFELQPFIYFAF